MLHVLPVRRTIPLVVILVALVIPLALNSSAFLRLADATCPDEEAYGRSCLVTIELCDRQPQPCAQRVYQESYPGPFGCRYHAGTHCPLSATVYMDCYKECECKNAGAWCFHTNTCNFYSQLIRTTADCGE
jgi:hypothetical protein